MFAGSGVGVVEQPTNKVGNKVDLNNLGLSSFPAYTNGSNASGVGLDSINWTTSFDNSDTGAMITNGKTPITVHVNPFREEYTKGIQLIDQLVFIDKDSQPKTPGAPVHMKYVKYTVITLPMINKMLYEQALYHKINNEPDDDTAESISARWVPLGVYHSQMLTTKATTQRANSWVVHVRGTLRIKNMWNTSIKAGQRLYLVLRRSVPPKRYTILPGETTETDPTIRPYQYIPMLLESTQRVLSKHFTFYWEKDVGLGKELVLDIGKAYYIGASRHSYDSVSRRIDDQYSNRNNNNQQLSWHTPSSINQVSMASCPSIEIQMELHQV